jgi:hypothetical protein
MGLYLRKLTTSMKKRGRTRKMKKKRVGTVKSRMCGFFQKGVFRSFGVGSGIVCEGNIILGVETHHTKNHSCPKTTFSSQRR